MCAYVLFLFAAQLQPCQMTQPKLYFLFAVTRTLPADEAASGRQSAAAPQPLLWSFQFRGAVAPLHPVSKLAAPAASTLLHY